MTEIEAQHEIETLQKIIDFSKDEREGLARDKKQLIKELSDAHLDLKRLKHEKNILLEELTVEIKRRIEVESKLFFINEDSKDLPF